MSRPLARRDSVWVKNAIDSIHADMNRSSETHLLKYPKLAASFRDIALYFKDESTHPTGSLKHRLARSLFLYALCNGIIVGPETKVFEASSGSTAISEAYFAKLIGLEDYTTVIPDTTAEAKKKLIQDYGGKVHETSGDIIQEAKRLAEEAHGYYMDQFTFSERATDWRGNNNIANTIFSQMSKEPEHLRIPKWIVCGAGTGGTSATIARYARYQGYDTKVCVVDPDGSAYLSKWAEYWGITDKIPERRPFRPSFIEGIGRREPAASFLPEIVEAMVPVNDNASVGAMQFLYETGMYYYGPSSGTNLVGAISAIHQMQKQNESGSIVTLLCDLGLRYATSFYNDDYLKTQKYDGKNCFDFDAIQQYKSQIRSFLDDGQTERLDVPTFRLISHS